ncbi:MAG TPA: DNA polymerase III subunit alpha [Thermodesulfobacteriota bacterium]|jgi:DNA polymerase-3 subunit alpha|nr:DNA polymerase III subunit alpha [Thermodesulfobacteriota bacterium]
MGNGFVHLHLHSQYSLLDGAIKFEELFLRVREYGMPAVALTDHGNLFGAFEFYKEAKKAGIKPIVGCEVYVSPGSRQDKSPEEKNHHLIVLSMNEEGYKNLSRLVTKAYFEGFYRKPRIDHELLDTHREGLIVLSGCLNGEFCKYILANDLQGALRTAAKYKEIFGDRYYLEVQANRLPEQEIVNQRIKEIGKRLGIPAVATNDCHYLRREDSKPHDILLCIQTGATVKDEKRFRFKGDEYFLKSREEMLDCLGGFEDEIERTLEVAERCDFEFKTNGYKFPLFELEGGKSLDEHMAHLAREGLERRLRETGISGSKVDTYKERLETEIETIKKMGFSGYFLVVSDFINHAKSHGIPVGPGRGSAAGSLVAYALGITEIDPIPYNLIFERFLNPERVSMPDIDVDFCAERRDEVIKYVTEKYGADKVAQIGTFGTMSAKAVVKDVGRVLGIPYADVDRVTKLIPTFRGKVSSIDDSISQIPQLKELIQKSPNLRELIEIARPLEDMVRHSSTHAAGIVISNEPLADYIPLYKGSRDEIVTQFDMDSIENLGFVKFDFLGLKTLTVIDKAVKFIQENHALETSKFDIKRIPLDDPDVYRLLSSGRTRGVFQIESPGMKELLMKLQPSTFEDIIAVLALYRPGPLDSGMVDEFIKRKHGQKRIDYPLSELKEILKDTYGLFVYQEQIMKTASVLADYSLGEADLLRRAMGKKKPEEMKAQRERFLEGARKKGISIKKAEEIFDAMEKFAEYSFNKSHSAAYALITYQTAYIKAHYPAEFMAALMSVESGNSDKVISSIAECKEMGIEVLPPDVNESMAGFTAADGKIRFGLSAIKNIGEGTVDAIIKAREEGGKFKSIFDFCERVDAKKINRKTFESLIKSGAFDSLGVNRAQLTEAIESLLTYTSAVQRSAPEGQNLLFTLSDSVSPPDLPDIEEWSEKEILKNEMEVLGFYVTSHPMAKYMREIRRYIDTDTEGILEIKEKREVTVAGVVRSLNIKHMKNGSGIFGNLVIEDMKGSVEVVVFNDLLRKSLPVLEEKAEPVIVKGVIEPSEERVRLKATDIFSMREMRNGSTVHISLKKEDATRDNLIKLKRVFEVYPGESIIYLHIETDYGEAVIEVGNCRVDIQDRFLEDVERLFGKGFLRLG